MWFSFFMAAHTTTENNIQKQDGKDDHTTDSNDLTIMMNHVIDICGTGRETSFDIISILI